MTKKLLEDGGMRACVKTVLHKLLDEKSPNIEIDFFDVTDMKIGDLQGGWAITLDIQDISSWGLECARFRCTDVESNILAFNCFDFKFLINNDEE